MSPLKLAWLLHEQIMDRRLHNPVSRPSLRCDPPEDGSAEVAFTTAATVRGAVHPSQRLLDEGGPGSVIWVVSPPGDHSALAQNETHCSI